MIGKKPDKVWCYGNWWDVVALLNPSKYDEYLLLQREASTATNGVPTKVMALVETGNDEFYPDTEKVRAMVEKKEKSEGSIKELDRELSDIWLEMHKN